VTVPPNLPAGVALDHNGDADFLTSMKGTFLEDCRTALAELVASKRLMEIVTKTRVPPCEWLDLLSAAEQGIATVFAEVSRRFFLARKDRDISHQFIIEFSAADRNTQETMTQKLANGKTQAAKSVREHSGADLESFGAVLFRLPIQDRAGTFRRVVSSLLQEDVSTCSVERLIQMVKRAQNKYGWKKPSRLDLEANRNSLLTFWEMKDVDEEEKREIIKKKDEAPKRRIRGEDIAWGQGETVVMPEHMKEAEKRNAAILHSLMIHQVVQPSPLDRVFAKPIIAHIVRRHLKNKSIEKSERNKGEWQAELKCVEGRKTMQTRPPIIGELQLPSRASSDLEKILTILHETRSILAVVVHGLTYLATAISGDYEFSCCFVENDDRAGQWIHWETPVYSDDPLWDADGIEVCGGSFVRGRFVLGEVLECEAVRRRPKREKLSGFDKLLESLKTNRNGNNAEEFETGGSNLRGNSSAGVCSLKGDKPKSIQSLTQAGLSDVSAGQVESERLRQRSENPARLLDLDPKKSSDRGHPVSPDAETAKQSAKPSEKGQAASSDRHPEGLSSMPVARRSEIQAAVDVGSDSDGFRLDSPGRVGVVGVIAADAEYQKEQEKIEIMEWQREAPSSKFAPKSKTRQPRIVKTEAQRKDHMLNQEAAAEIDLSQWGKDFQKNWILSADACDRKFIKPRAKDPESKKVSLPIFQDLRQALRDPELRATFDTVGASGRKSLAVSQDNHGLRLVAYALKAEWLLYGVQQRQEQWQEIMKQKMGIIDGPTLSRIRGVVKARQELERE